MTSPQKEVGADQGDEGRALPSGSGSHASHGAASVSAVPVSIPSAEISLLTSGDQQAHSCNKEKQNGYWWLDGYGQHNIVLLDKHHDRRRRRRALTLPGRRQSGRHDAPGTGFRATKNPSAQTVTARRVGDMPSSRFAALRLISVEASRTQDTEGTGA